MIPSFVLAVIPEYVIPHFSGIISVVSLVHVVAGALAGSVGV
jgi:hypothetical protein